MTELIDKEFSPVLAMVLERGPGGLENFRRGTHANAAPEVVDHCKVLVAEARKCAEKLAANKRQLEEHEKRLVVELNEQRSLILGEMEREVNEARSKMKALKERRELELQQQQLQQQPQQQQQYGSTDDSIDHGNYSASTPSSGGTPFVGGTNRYSIQNSSSSNQQAPKSAASTLLASLSKRDDNGAGPPGDVDYWRAQAQDLHLVVEGRQETLKSVQARIRSISHLSEHQDRARGIIGLLRQAEYNERQKAAEYLRKAQQIKDQAAAAAASSMRGGGASSSNSRSQKQRDSMLDLTSASAIAMLTEAETNGLESILNTLEPRVDVAKEALRLYTGRVERLQKRLEGIESRRKQLATVGYTLPQVLKYVNDVKAECQAQMSKVDPPNLAIVNILKKQHGEALQRLNRNADSMMALKLEVADLETQLREAKVNAIRSMHGTAAGTTERLAQLRALRAAEVVQNQIQGIETECDRLRMSLYQRDSQQNIQSNSSSSNARVRSGSLRGAGPGGFPLNPKTL